MSPGNPFEKNSVNSPEVLVRRIVVPDDELEMTAANSGGPGGQGVNTSKSKAVLFWHVGASKLFTDEEKERIRIFFGKRYVDGDRVKMECSTNRSPQQNREEVKERLNDLLTKAIEIPKERKPTKPTKGSQRERLNDKTAQGRKKAERRQRHDE